MKRTRDEFIAGPSRAADPASAETDEIPAKIRVSPVTTVSTNTITVQATVHSSAGSKPPQHTARRTHIRRTYASTNTPLSMTCLPPRDLNVIEFMPMSEDSHRYAMRPMGAAQSREQHVDIPADDAASTSFFAQDLSTNVNLREREMFHTYHSVTDYLYMDAAYKDTSPVEMTWHLPEHAIFKANLDETDVDDVYAFTNENIECNICGKTMKLYFAFQENGKSRIYDKLKFKDTVRPRRIDDQHELELAHNSCMGTKSKEGRNYLYHIYEQYLPFLQWWKTGWNFFYLFWLCISIVSVPVFMVVAIIFIALYKNKTEIWEEIIFVIVLSLLAVVYGIKLYALISTIKIRWTTWYKTIRHVKLMIWKPLLPPPNMLKISEL